MNALILANRLPFPLDDGWKVRTWHIIEAVASVGRATLAVADPGSIKLLDEARRALPGVEIVPFKLGRKNGPLHLVAGAITPMPVSYWNQQSRDAHRCIKRLTMEQPFDLGVAVLIHMYPYLKYLGPSARRIVDTHNVDSANMHRYVQTLPHGPRRLYASLTARKLRRLESRVFAAADETWVCSGEDAAEVQRIEPSAQPAVVPNGVDTSQFAPSGAASVPGRLLFFGRLDYFPNEEALGWFVRDLLPRIRSLVPEAHLEVVGHGALPSLTRLLEASPGVRLRGPVDDVPAALAEASVVVVPLRAGGGTRLKILEALGSARPVVSTTVGAEGLTLLAGSDILIADDPEGFVDSVVGLLRDPEAAARLGAAGRATVQRLYDWKLVQQRAAALITAGRCAEQAAH